MTGQAPRRLPSYAVDEQHHAQILAAIRADGDTAPPLSRRLKQLLRPVSEAVVLAPESAA